MYNIHIYFNEDIIVLLSLLSLQITFTRNIVWTLSNLCRNKNPPPPFDVVRTALPVLNRLLSNSDKDILGKLIIFI